MNGWSQLDARMVWGAEKTQAAVGTELGTSSPICAAVIPFPSLASTSGSHFPLSIYREVELGTQPKIHLFKCPGWRGKVSRTSFEEESVHLSATRGGFSVAIKQLAGLPPTP